MGAEAGWRVVDRGRHYCNPGRTTVAGAGVLGRKRREVVGPGSVTKVELKTGCADEVDVPRSPGPSQNFRLSSWTNGDCGRGRPGGQEGPDPGDGAISLRPGSRMPVWSCERTAGCVLLDSRLEPRVYCGCDT